MKPLRIAFITSHINKSTQWEWFSEELVRRNIFHIHIIMNPGYPQLADDLKRIGVTCYFFRTGNLFLLVSAFFKIATLLLRHRINLVHTELPHGNLLGQAAAYACRIKSRVTTTENTTWAHDYNNRKQLFIERFTYKRAKHIVALTELSAKYIHEKYHQPVEKITAIGHSLKLEAYRHASERAADMLRTELKLDKNDFVIGMVARFEGWKGHLYVAEAFASILKKRPNARLLIAGGKGDSYENVVNRIKELGVGNSVTIVPFVNDNISIYRLFNIHVHVPVSEMAESFGIAIIEGMISGCAQVLTRSGISVETAVDGVNCIVVGYKSSEQVAGAIEWLIDHPAEAKRMGDKAREDATRQFDYRKKVDRHIEIYNRLMAK